MRIESEEIIEKEIEEWDIVTCATCGKRISMLDAKIDEEQENFYCKTH